MKRTTSFFLRLSSMLVLILAACLLFAQLKPEKTKPAGKSAAPAAAKKPAISGSASLQSHRNIGKAYYEQGKYAEAIIEFQKVVAAGQALATDHLHLGLALMQANKLDEALGELTTAKQMVPKLVAADFNLGILYKRELRYPDAEAALKRVIDADPNDPAAWFNLGTVCFAQKKLDQALDAHQHVVDMGFGRGQNFYVASLFHSFTTLVRLKRQPEAQKTLKIHEKMRDKVPGISLQNPALEGGKYGAILVPPVPLTQVARRAASEKVAFVDITARLGITSASASSPSASPARKEIKASEYSLDFARQNLVPLFGPSIAVGDYDGDGRPDLYVVNPSGPNRLFHNNGDATFSDVSEKAGVAGSGGSLSATFADYNNSGHASLFVVGVDGVKLYRNTGDGKFVDETEKAGLQGEPGELDTRAILFDADNDGLLDLVVTTYTDLNAPPQKDSFTFPDDFAGAATRFYRNNGDGTFTEIGASAGLAAVKGRGRGAVFADFNNDGYTDLLLFRDDGPPLLYLNQGEDKFVDRTAAAGTDLSKFTVVDAQVADFDHDGNFDLALWSPSGYRVLLNRGGARFAATPNLPAITPPEGPFAFRGVVVDMNADSFADLVAVDASGNWRLIANRAGRFQEIPLSLPLRKGEPLTSLIPAWLGNPGILDLVGITRSGQVTALEKEGPPARWLEVKFLGYKSNTEGIGSVVELKAGNFYNKVVATGGPVRVYTGDLPKLDVVRVTWPNAVIQNWIDVATNKPVQVRESERLASSCPLLYIWDGERFVYLTDVLGVAPIGELAPDGTRIKPNPREFVRLPGNLRERDGKYMFQLSDELREVDYIDQVRLLAVDHPTTEEVFANEIYSSAAAPPTLYTVRQKHLPVSAVDEHAHDVLPLIRERDGRYPDDFRQQRILGLADLHSLTLDLGDLPDSGQAALWLTGWVFWTDSNGSRALMSNKQLEMVPPYLQVRNPQGEWVTVIPDMGVPSATNRTMRVDLAGKFLSPDHHLRVVTNFCVYWDQIWFTTDDATAPAPVELPLVSADLHYRGFSAVSSDPTHHRPDHFEYAKLMADAPWNPMVGRYTRYGAVEKLLNRADDRMVVMSAGDEMTVEFDARKLPSLKPGWKRDFFLHLEGWAKDGEPNTAYAKTVAPLPFRRMSNYPYGKQEPRPSGPQYQRYLDEYQTRPGYKLIPPLAPATR
jgi:tetratricopeptide (TPR) repeat protein